MQSKFRASLTRGGARRKLPKSATVALLRERFPREGPAQITGRLLAAADPPAAGVRPAEYGHGLLNPYRALTGVAEAAPVEVRGRALRFSAVALAVAALAGALLAAAGRMRVVAR